MAQQNGDTNEDPTTVISKLQGLVPRLGNDEDLEGKKECLQLAKTLTAQLEPPELTAVEMAFSVLFRIP